MANEPSIKQMNEVIARFMGYEATSEFIRKNCAYERNWNVLMQVVEKIRGMGYHIEITISVDCSVEIIKLLGDPEKDVLRIIAYSTPINAVYTAVYQFITWFNANQQKQPNDTK